MAGHARIRALVVTAILAIIFTACGGEDRPSLDEWQPAWDRIVELMPTATELGDPPDRAMCSEVLGEIRTARAELFPTPDAAIEAVVRDWVSAAEDALFECPPSSSDLPDLDAVYARLDRLEAEVATVLELDREP